MTELERPKTEFSELRKGDDDSQKSLFSIRNFLRRALEAELQKPEATERFSRMEMGTDEAAYMEWEFRDGEETLTWRPKNESQESESFIWVLQNDEWLPRKGA